MSETGDRAYLMTTTDSGTPVRLLAVERQPQEECLTLTPHELAWLNEFRKRLRDRYPESVRDILVHDLRTRGIADADLWMHVLVLTGDEHPLDCDEIDSIAYDVSLIDHSHPRVNSVPESVWAEMQAGQRPMRYSYRNIGEGSISVW